MSLHYHLVKRTLIAGKDAGKEKYFGQVRAGNTIGLDAICSQISRMSTATKGEVTLVLNGMIDALVDYLSAGHIVQLGDLGNFRPSAGSDGAGSEEEFTLNLMRPARVLFSPGRELRTVLAKTGFRRLDLKVEQKIIPCDKEHLGE